MLSQTNGFPIIKKSLASTFSSKVLRMQTERSLTWDVIIYVKSAYVYICFLCYGHL